MFVEVKPTEHYYTQVSVSDKCKICQNTTSPIKVAESTRQIANLCHRFCITRFCLQCQHYFVDEFEVNQEIDAFANITDSLTQLEVRPELPSDIPITDEVATISPTGKAIYTQALKAEQEHLDHIAGIGYRKALEFFVKDFTIALKPDDKEKISKLLLKQVIDNYIDDEQLKTFATATAYIGNDETHYTRKHSDKDLLALKRYLKGFLHHMDMKLSFLDAHELVNRPK